MTTLHTLQAKHKGRWINWTQHKDYAEAVTRAYQLGAIYRQNKFRVIAPNGGVELTTMRQA